MNEIILQGTTPEAIAQIVCDMFESRFDDLKKSLTTQNPDDDLMSREQVLELLQINASTLYLWTRKGRITVYKYANKCYYKKAELLAGLIPLKK
jgi:hypothetical protein